MSKASVETKSILKKSRFSMQSEQPSVVKSKKGGAIKPRFDNVSVSVKGVDAPDAGQKKKKKSGLRFDEASVSVKNVKTSDKQKASPQFEHDAVSFAGDQKVSFRLGAGDDQSVTPSELDRSADFFGATPKPQESVTSSRIGEEMSFRPPQKDGRDSVSDSDVSSISDEDDIDESVQTRQRNPSFRNGKEQKEELGSVRLKQA